MRRALVIDRLGMNGSARVLSGLASAWAERGDAVTIVCLSGGEPFYSLHPVVRVRQLAGESAPQPAIRRVWRLREAIVEAAPDIVLVFGDRAAVLTLLAAVGLRLPICVAERRDPVRFPIGGRSWRALRRALFPLADALVLQTEAVARRYPSAWRSRIHVIPNPVVVPEKPADLAVEGTRRLIAVGRLAPEKGFDLLIRAFGRVALHHPDWTLIIWGEGSERAWLERLCGDLGLTDRVALPGATTDVPLELAQAALFALPSRSEGFPNALCEALAGGLPIVAFDCRDGPRELIRDGIDGVLVPPEDVVALAAALDRLMGDPRERQRLSDATSAVAARFSPEHVLAQWDGLIAEVVESRRGHAARVARVGQG